MAGEGRRLFGQTTPSELPDKFQMSVRMPVGVVGAITPWNFPIAIPRWKITPALVCGNTVVFKPATDTPAARASVSSRSSRRPGCRRASSTSCTAAASDRRRARSSSTPTCRVISLHGLARDRRSRRPRTARRSLKHVHLELGGKNAIIVMDDADLDLAVDGILWSAFGTSGQRCTAASRVIVARAVYDELAVEARRARGAAAARPGLRRTTRTSGR